MPDKSMPFVITDRRKFTTEGEPRPDADPTPERTRETVPERTAEGESERKVELASERTLEHEPADAIRQTPQVISQPRSTAEPGRSESGLDLDPSAGADLPPAPSDEQMEQSRLAYQATSDRLETALRAANPGADHPPALSFESLVQSVYMQAILQLGGGTQEGQQPQVDILGAKQSIDMLGVLSEKTSGNLSSAEETTLLSAVFELRLAFLEITQALARSAQQRAPGPGAPLGSRPGPSIVR